MTLKDDIFEPLKKNYGIDPMLIVREVKEYLPEFNEKKFIKAFNFAIQSHGDQCRKSGDPYIIHPFETVKILTFLHADESTLIAGLLHDVPEDTSSTIDDVASLFGKKVAFLVDGVTKLSKVHYKNDMAKRHVESLKKLFVHTAKDPRIILIKLADRLHNMRTLHFIKKEEKQRRISMETLEIFVPIANLLGIDGLKSSLEDLCFKYIHPSDYQLLNDRLKISRDNNKEVCDNIINTVEKNLKDNNINFTIYRRLRRLYSLYKRIVHNVSTLQEYEHSVAIRIIVDNKDECYKVLGVLHAVFKPRPGRFKDYIAIPKKNGYQSLHTSVFGYNGINIDFQVRTNAMHLEAEYGIAAIYFHDQCGNECEKPHLKDDKRSSWANKIIQIQKQLDSGVTDDEDYKFMEGLKDDIFHDRIFIFTPRGDQIDLPLGATCIDFAYEIHSEVGNRALKAEINGKISPMTKKLNNGDTVNIITSDIERSPNQSWLDFAKTTIAKTRILEAFKKISRKEKFHIGKKLLQKELDRAGLGLLKNISQKQIKRFLEKHKRYNNLDDILVGISEGTMRPRDFVNTLYPKKDVPKCRIHKFFRRIFNIEERKYTPVNLRVVSEDSVGQLRKILSVLSALNLNSMKTTGYISYFKKQFVCRLTVHVHNYSEVSTLFENLEQMDGVKRVERLFWRRQFMFFMAVIFTFSVWAAHPYILFFIEKNWITGVNPFISGFLLYSGIFLLFMIVYLLKNVTQRSFPELRETNAFWIITLLLSIFALITLFAEIYFFEIEFNWGIVIGLLVLFFSYLTSEFIHYKEQS